MRYLGGAEDGCNAEDGDPVLQAVLQPLLQHSQVHPAVLVHGDLLQVPPTQSLCKGTVA